MSLIPWKLRDQSTFSCVLVWVSGERSRGEILGAAQRVVEETLGAQKALGPEERALFEVDYISLADPQSLVEVEEVDPAKGAVLSGAVKMLEVEKPVEGEDLGYSGGPPVRLIDNIVLKPGDM